MTPKIYTLSLHDALPIFGPGGRGPANPLGRRGTAELERRHHELGDPDRKSTRLNSSHANISYAVFCLKKKTATLVRTRDKCCRSGDPSRPAALVLALRSV